MTCCFKRTLLSQSLNEVKILRKCPIRWKASTTLLSHQLQGLLNHKVAVFSLRLNSSTSFRKLQNGKSSILQLTNLRRWTIWNSLNHRFQRIASETILKNAVRHLILGSTTSTFLKLILILMTTLPWGSPVTKYSTYQLPSTKMSSFSTKWDKQLSYKWASDACLNRWSQRRGSQSK